MIRDVWMDPTARLILLGRGAPALLIVADKAPGRGLRATLAVMLLVVAGRVALAREHQGVHNLARCGRRPACILVQHVCTLL